MDSTILEALEHCKPTLKESFPLQAQLEVKVVQLRNCTGVEWKHRPGPGRPVKRVLFQVALLKERLFPVLISRTQKLAEQLFLPEELLPPGLVLDLKSLSSITSLSQALLEEQQRQGISLAIAIPFYLSAPGLKPATLDALAGSFWAKEMLARSAQDFPLLLRQVRSQKDFDLLCELLYFFAEGEAQSIQAQNLWEENSPYQLALSEKTWQMLGQARFTSLAESLIANVNSRRQSASAEAHQLVTQASRVELEFLGLVFWGELELDQVRRILALLDERFLSVFQEFAFSKNRYSVWQPKILFETLAESFRLKENLEHAMHFMEKTERFLVSKAHGFSRMQTIEPLLLAILITEAGLSSSAEYYSTFISERAPIELFALFVLDWKNITEEMPLEWWITIERQDNVA